MNSFFYNIYKSYDENFKQGPKALNKLKKPVFKKSLQKFKFLNFPVNSPFGIPAGPMLNSKFVKEAFEFGFDVVHYKTQRSVSFPCNTYPNVLFVDIKGDLTLKQSRGTLIGKSNLDTKSNLYSITNSFGNPSKGPDFWQKDMKKSLKYARKGQLLIASVVGTVQKGFTKEKYYNDFVKTALLAKETGIKAIELNLSCPNVANEGVLCYSKDAVFRICKKTKEKIGNTKLLIKIGYYSKAQNTLLESIIRIVSPFIDGVAAINTISASIVDKNGRQALPGVNRLKSGVCGASIKWAGIDMVKRLAKIRKKLKKNFAIIGVGGVMTPNDFLYYQKVGADLIQSATGAMWNPYLAHQISTVL